MMVYVVSWKKYVRFKVFTSEKHQKICCIVLIYVCIVWFAGYSDHIQAGIYGQQAAADDTL